MRKIIFLLLLLPLVCHAQMPCGSQPLNDFTIVDTAKYELTYKMLFTASSGDTLSTDIRKVLVGRNIVKDYSNIMAHYDSIATAYVNRGEDFYPGCQQLVFPYEIFNHYRDNTTRIYYRLFMYCGVLRYEEKPAEMEWSLIPDSQENVIGFSCNKAVTQYKGRTYTAWYCPQMPVKVGPFKFGGLPGLILKVADSDNKFSWEIIGIKNVNEPIYEYKYDNVTACSRQKARKTIQRMFHSPLAFVAAAGHPVYIVDGNGKPRRADIEKDDEEVKIDFLEKE